LRIAANKRPVSEKQIREFAYGFEDETNAPEISREEIGRRVLEFLQAADAVAYIRFLSVYHDFDSVDRFIEDIQQLPGKPEAAARSGEAPKPGAAPGPGESGAAEGTPDQPPTGTHEEPTN